MITLLSSGWHPHFTALKLRVTLLPAVTWFCLCSFLMSGPLVQAQPLVKPATTAKKSPFPDLIFADQPILNSIAREDAGALREALNGDAGNLNLVHKSGYTPLSAAARVGNRELVQILLDKGAKIEVGTRENSAQSVNAILMAAASGSIEVMQLLLDKGADLQAPQNGPVLNLAVQNGRREMISFLVDKGISLEGSRSGGYSPLILAIQSNLPEMVQFLIEKGAKVNPAEHGNNAYSGYGTPLFSAVQQSNKPIVELLMANGANPMQANRSDNQTPLSFALTNGRRDLVELMLVKSVDINQKDKRGQTLLHLVLTGDGSMTKLLLDKGADINARNSSGYSPLHIAAQTGTIAALKVLLDYHADLNAKTPFGDTPLHLSVSRPPIATAFLAAGADVSIRNARGNLPLHAALRLMLDAKSESNRDATLKMCAALVEKSDVNAKDQLGFSPLQLALLCHQPSIREAILARNPKIDNITAFFDAVARDDTNEVKKLLENKSYLAFMRWPNGQTPLHIAALWNAKNSVDYLLKKGVDINTRDAEANTPLMTLLSADNGDVSPETVGMANYLLDNGADLQSLDNDDESVVHLAVRRGSKELLNVVLKRGANPNTRNRLNQTPLDLLLPGAYEGRTRRLSASLAGLNFEKNISRDLVALLLEKGAEQKEVDTQGNTPLLRAVAMRDAKLVELLLNTGADVNAINSQGETALMRYVSYASNNKDSIEIAKLLIEKGADINASTQYGESVLLRALGNSNIELTRFIVEKGADLNASRAGGDVPLFRIISMGDSELLKLALTKKLDVNVRDSAGYTPLMRAVMYSDGETKLVEALIEAGAEVNTTSPSGQTALDLVRRGNNELTEFLKAHGTKSGRA